MTRHALIHMPGEIYSVVSKCNNDEFHFNADDKFNSYLNHLMACKEKMGFEIFDIVCMSNHVHELYRVPATVSISQILQRVKGHFALRFNRRFGRKDHFWRNKPFYRIVENEEYAFHAMHYYHWNPVHAGMVDHPAEWPYSGYRFHILNERKGIIGKLLAPLPGIDPSELLLAESLPLQSEIKELLSSTKNIFIGNPGYIARMNNRFK